MSARRDWCGAGEPVLWALWQVGHVFRVKGLKESGVVDDSFGMKLGRGVGRATKGAGPAALYVLGTAVFGGGEDSGRSGTTTREPDLTIAGDNKDCAAVQLIRTPRPEGAEFRTKLWVLTPTRLGVLVASRAPAPKDAPAPVESGITGHVRQLGRGWGDVGRALAGTTPEKFGKNEPGEPLDALEVSSWLEIAPGDVADFSVVGPQKSSPQWRHCALQLADGSGFVLNGKTPADAQHMVEAMRRGWGRG